LASRSIFKIIKFGKLGFLLLPLFLSGCSTVSYLAQAAQGQLSLFNHERPIEEVIKDEKTPTRIKLLLAEIPSIKKYGEANGLKPTKNYQDYVQLDRNSAVYVVSACEPLKFQSKEWGFPIVGKFPYLGFFKLDMAKDYAKDLKAEGLDVDLRGASAYSTLGWFRDPILSSMIPEGDQAYGELVNVVLHESVHATLYIGGQAYFNESLAVFVADKLTVKYITEHKGPDSPQLNAYVKGNTQYEDNDKYLHGVYEKLDALYKSPQTDAEKLEEKKKILDEAQTKLQWKREINNATLIQFKEYSEGMGAFETVYKACGSDTERFLKVLSSLNGASFSKSQQSDLDPVLLPLAPRCSQI
jgi:predicted aminopeptidase